MSETGGKKEWQALVKVYDFLYSEYPDFRKQVDEYGFSVIESNEKGDLILEMDIKDADIVVNHDKVFRMLKKAGLKKFSRIGNLTFDKILEYEYDMVKGLSNILVRRGDGGSLSLNLHFYYVEAFGLPSVDKFLKKRGRTEWSGEVALGDYSKTFNNLIVKPLFKEGLYWVNMNKGILRLSVVGSGEIIEDVKYGDDKDIDAYLEKVLEALPEIFQFSVKEVFILGDNVDKVRYRKNSDGEISVVAY